MWERDQEPRVRGGGAERPSEPLRGAMGRMPSNNCTVTVAWQPVTPLLTPK